MFLKRYFLNAVEHATAWAAHHFQVPGVSISPTAFCAHRRLSHWPIASGGMFSGSAYLSWPLHTDSIPREGIKPALALVDRIVQAH
jgi:hypothetical protein